ncbi:Aspartyl protease, partial [Globisporangium splendens]
MVRIFQKTAAASLLLLAVASAVVVDVKSTAPQGMTLQLHRIEDHAKTHSEVYRRRRLQNVDGELEVVPLNLGLGTHYAWVYAGTPPQRASVITDTGSGLMAFPCSGCTGCGDHTDQPFAAAASSTLTHVTCAAANPFFTPKCKNCGADTSQMCNISQAYMEGSSWDATVVEDIVYLGDADSLHNEQMRNQFGTHFMFGCQNHETGLFISQVADGIMGLSNNDDNLVAKLYKEKKIPNKLFSLCFGYDGGSMSIGVPDTARHKGKIAYAKLGPDPTRSHFYNVMLRDVRIGNDTIDAPAKSYSQGHFIVDSGTTDSYLPSSMKAAFEAAFEKVTGLKYQASGAGCKGYTDEDLDALPNIQIVLEAEDGGDLVLEVTPDQYLIQESGGHYCASVFLTEFSGGVIGANIMTDRDVIFDSGSQRVGFVDADCAYSNATAPSSAPRDKPAPGVVASSNVDTSKTSPTPNPSPKHVLPPAPTLTPVPSPTPGLKPTVAPTTAPTPKPTLRPTVAPSPIPVAASVDFDTESSKSSSESAPVLTPVPESTATTSTTHLNHANTASEDEHPMVLTIVGTVLVAVFLLVVAASIKFKKNKKDHNWSRVKENEDDVDDEEEELDPHVRSKKSRGKQPLRSDDIDSDDDDDDDEDEIFDREAHNHEDTKHDTRMLERL